MAKVKIKKGDQVLVIAGVNKGGAPHRGAPPVESYFTSVMRRVCDSSPARSW